MLRAAAFLFFSTPHILYHSVLRNIYLGLICVCLWVPCARAQYGFHFSTISIGGGVGAAHYFGDLNPLFDRIEPGVTATAFMRYAFNEYLAWRTQLAFTHVGYDDKFAHNASRKLRNLNFRTNIYEWNSQFDFHFFRYLPGKYGYNFTPYLTAGLGLFYFRSTAQYNGEAFPLRPFHTEGVDYAPVALSVPVGIGIKWGLTPKVNVGFELSYHFTGTDYLDDVSRSYTPSAQTPIQDPSSLGHAAPIGIPNRQRGQSQYNDAYLQLQFMLSVNLFTYKCPQAFL